MNQTDDHRLSPHVLPSLYQLVLEPDLGTLTFRGEVTIDVSVRQEAEEIALHAAELEISEAAIGGAPVTLRWEAERERVVLVPARPLPPGPARIALRFKGTINDKMRGFYRSTYTRPDGTKGILATTQFESTSARRAFPCMDEPAFKAAFDITLVVPRGLTAVSNGPVASETAEGPRRRIRYGRTPVMSTYLVAFAVGEFDRIEGKTRDGVPVRVYATPGRAELGRFAMETAIKGLEFFGEYYGIPYQSAISKLDLLGIPDFEFGAMENWGAVTFRETAIFVDPKTSSVPQRRRVAEVVLHELAHQWFGNLVSPEWWSYLWLNESFATFMAYKAIDAIYPEWKPWEEYLADITSEGKNLDSLRSSHPVEVPVRDPNEVDQLFDAISYNKGGSVLRMLEQSIGEIPFRDGVRRYLARHAYACATTDDLWTALGEGAPRMMDGWTRTTGMPVVQVDRRGRLRQERFLLDRDPAKPDSDPAVWEIPIAVVDASGARRWERLDGREGTIPVPASGWVKLNAGQPGFFRVQYDDEGWRALAGAVKAKALATADRYGLQEDAYALMRAGYLPVAGYLRLVEAYAGEEEHDVWGGLSGGVGALADIFVGDPRVPRLEEWVRKLVAPVVAKVGWDERADEPHDTLLLRAVAVGMAVHFGDPGAIGQVQARFRQGLASLPPNLRSTILWGAARHGGPETLDALVKLYEGGALPEVQVQLLRAMGSFRREDLLRRSVAYALSDKVRPQDAMYVFAGVPSEGRAWAWALLQEHWPVIDQRYGKSGLIGRFITLAAGGIPSEAHAAAVEAFFKAHPAPYASEKIRQTLESIRARSRFRDRNRNALAEFFGA